MAYFLYTWGKIMENYEINKETLAIIPIEEEISKVIEEERELIINASVMKIIDDSCKFFGSSYDGRFEGTKKIMGISHKSPIIVEETRKIIFFPTTSPRINTCCWIALNNIKDYYKSNDNTVIIFNCGKKIKLHLSYPIIDNQVLRATRLEALLNKRIEEIEKTNKKVALF